MKTKALKEKVRYAQVRLNEKCNFFIEKVKNRFFKKSFKNQFRNLSKVFHQEMLVQGPY
jgi:hypothetical protein